MMEHNESKSIHISGTNMLAVKFSFFNLPLALVFVFARSIIILVRDLSWCQCRELLISQPVVFVTVI